MFIKASKRYFYKLLTIFFGMLLVTLPFVLLQIYFPKQLHSIASIVSQYLLFFMLFRWTLIGSIFYFWPKIVHFKAKKEEWSDELTHFWLSQRFRMTGWLIIFEVVICENLLLTLIKAI